MLQSQQQFIRRSVAGITLSLVIFVAQLSASVASEQQQAPQAPATQHRLQELANALVESKTPSVDDPLAEFTNLLKAATGIAQSAASAIAIHEASAWVSALQDPAQGLTLVDGYLAAKPHALGAQAAQVLAQRILRQLGKFEAARARGTYDSYASYFQVAGPFGDSGDYFTNTPFPPQFRFPGPKQTLKGRFGPTQSHVVRRKPHQRSVRLIALGSDHGGCFFALHQVEAQSATSGYAEITSSSSLELFVNNGHCFTVDQHAERKGTRHYIPIQLEKGANQVLIKTNLADYSWISLRYIDAGGRPLTGLSEQKEHRVIEPARGSDLPPLPGAFPDGLKVLLAAVESSDNNWLRLAAVFAALDQRNANLALDLLTPLQRSLPSDQLQALAVAEAISRISVIPSEIRNGQARQILDRIGDALGTHHHLRMKRIGFLRDDDKSEEAVRILQGIVDSKKAGPDTFNALSRLLKKLRFEVEYAALRKTWREALPLDTRPLLAAVDSKIRGGNRRGALTELKDAHRRQTGERGIQARILNLALDLGEESLALEMLEKINRDDPKSISAVGYNARALRRLGQSKKSLTAYRTIAEHKGASASQTASAARWLMRGGQRKAALAAYHRSLKQDPSQHDLRRLLGRLEQKAEDFPMISQFRYDGDELMANFVATDREKGAAATLVLDQMIVRYDADGSWIQEIHTLRRINDLSGVEAYEEAEAAAEASELVLLRTVLKGKTYVPTRVAQTFSMPRLEPGAFIEEIYRDKYESPEPGPWHGPWFYFQGSDEPYLHSELVLILPPGHKGEIRQRNYPGKPRIVKLDDGYTAHVFRQTDVPRLRTEKRTPGMEDIVPVVTYGEDGAMAEVARKAYTSASYRAHSTPIVEARTEVVIQGQSTDREKFDSIYNFVHEAIANSRGDADPTSILLRKSGPRFFLLVAMLQAAQIRFDHIIAQPSPSELTRSSEPFFLGEDEYSLPGIILHLKGEDPLWLFVDAPRYLPPGHVDSTRMNAPALVLGSGTHRLVRVPGGDLSANTGWRFRGQLTLNQDKSASLSAEAEVQNQRGFGMAEQIRNLPANRKELIARNLTSQMFSGWTVEKAELKGIEKGASLRPKAQLRRGQALKAAGTDFILPLPLPASNMFGRLGDRSGRQLPMRLSSLTSDRWEISVDPGEHFRLIEIPESVRVRTHLIDYTLYYRLRDGKLIITRRMLMRPGRIEPEAFDEWVKLLRHIDQAEKAGIKFAAR